MIRNASSSVKLFLLGMGLVEAQNHFLKVNQVYVLFGQSKPLAELEKEYRFFPSLGLGQWSSYSSKFGAKSDAVYSYASHLPSRITLHSLKFSAGLQVLDWPEPCFGFLPLLGGGIAFQFLRADYLPKTYQSTYLEDTESEFGAYVDLNWKVFHKKNWQGNVVFDWTQIFTQPNNSLFLSIYFQLGLPLFWSLGT